jgi:hypothetical protein
MCCDTAGNGRGRDDICVLLADNMNRTNNFNNYRQYLEQKNVP